uniref:Uncharacterized protein n=1 Tax=Fagus sylvatica TaxID=28930 RepID=A0A2N9HU74_FAGSY
MITTFADSTFFPLKLCGGSGGLEVDARKEKSSDDKSVSLNKSCGRLPKELMGLLELFCIPPPSNNPPFKLVPILPKFLSGKKSHGYGSDSAGPEGRNWGFNGEDAEDGKSLNPVMTSYWLRLVFRVKDQSFKVKDDFRTLYLRKYIRECSRGE